MYSDSMNFHQQQQKTNKKKPFKKKVEQVMNS